MATEGINRSGNADLQKARELPVERANASVRLVDDRAVYAGKLSLNQLIAGARLLVTAATRMTAAERQQLAQASQEAAQGKGEELLAGLASVLTLLDEETVRRLFGIVLDEDATWCGQHIGAADALWAMEALLDHNEMEELRGTFFRLLARFAPSPGQT